MSNERWRTPYQPLTTRLLFWRFIPIYPWRIHMGIVGYDVEGKPGHCGAKNAGLDNLFIFLIILWKYDEWKSVFPCAELSGCFLARLIVTWIHFLVNELQECDSIDIMCPRLIPFFVEMIYFETIYDRAGRRFLATPQLCVPLNLYVRFHVIRLLFRYYIKLFNAFQVVEHESGHCGVGYWFKMINSAALSAVSLFRFVRNRSARKKFFPWPWTT